MREIISKNGIIGFIIGDCIGVPVEFKTRYYLKNNKVTDMQEYGTHYQPKGTWSDDSSMTIATMQSIIDTRGDIDLRNIMDNFLLWSDEGDYTPNNEVFDIGTTTQLSLQKYKETNNINNRLNYYYSSGNTDYYSNGNGSLMRILPIAYYCYSNELKVDDISTLVSIISALTHSHGISVLGCFIYVLFSIELLKGKSKEEAYIYIKNYEYINFNNEIKQVYTRILSDDISKLNIDDINSSGFIVDTLEAVLWSFLNTNNYKDSVLTAVNLGGDTDTIGALVGGLSGIYYGYETIPKEWLKSLIKKDYLERICNDFDNINVTYKKQRELRQEILNNSWPFIPYDDDKFKNDLEYRREVCNLYLEKLKYLRNNINKKDMLINSTSRISTRQHNVYESCFNEFRKVEDFNIYLRFGFKQIPDFIDGFGLKSNGFTINEVTLLNKMIDFVEIIISTYITSGKLKVKEKLKELKDDYFNTLRSAES